MEMLAMKNITEKESDALVEQSIQTMRSLEKYFDKIRKIIIKSEPHTRIYLLNEMIARLVAYSNMPPFVVVSVLDGLKHVFQNMPPVRHQKIESDISDYAKSYIG